MKKLFSFTLLLLCFLPINTKAQSDEVNNAFKALKALYKATDGGNWANNTDWDTTAVPTSMEAFRSWHGINLYIADRIDCDVKLNKSSAIRHQLVFKEEKRQRGNRVWIGLNLTGNNLVGEIPPEIAGFSSFIEITLSENSLRGEIPTELGSLTTLCFLRVRDNQLQGRIPNELAQITDLKILSLGVNNFVGGIPPALGQLSNLEVLSFQGIDRERRAVGQMGGTIPPELGNLRSLRSLAIGYNRFEGGIPREIGNLVELEQLWLLENQLTGEIPPELGNLTKLKILRTHGNRIRGTIPATFWNFADIEVMMLDSHLSGEMDPAMGNLKNLRILALYNMRGEIPKELGGLSKLTILHLHGLTGSIPPELGNLTDLELLTLSTCSGSGCYVINEDGEQEQLEDGDLQGEIPRSFLRLTKLENLYLPSAVCAPPDDEFQTWLGRLGTNGISKCTTVSTEQEPAPIEFTVHQNYPNPFTTSTNLVFDLPRPADVEIEVLDVLGRQVHRQSARRILGGSGQEIKLSMEQAPAGIYFYRITTSDQGVEATQTGMITKTR